MSPGGTRTSAEGTGEHRLVCSQLPDGRPALVANLDVDTHPVGQAPAAGAAYAHAGPLEAAGWARWPDAPRVVGWTDPARTTVVTRLGEWTFPGDPAWWALVADRGEVAVLVLLDRSVDAWASARSYAEIAGWLDSAVLYAGLCRALRADTPPAAGIRRPD